jgi:hypothetical protein
MSRMGVNSPTYVAGFERGVRPDRRLVDVDDFVDLLDPVIFLCAPGDPAAPCSLRAKRRWRISLTSVLFPSRNAGDARQLRERETAR